LCPSHFYIGDDTRICSRKEIWPFKASVLLVLFLLLQRSLPFLVAIDHHLHLWLSWDVVVVFGQVKAICGVTSRRLAERRAAWKWVFYADSCE